MIVDLKEFMTDAEKEQISQVLDKAERRMKRQHRQQPDTLLYLDRQCRAYEQILENRKKLEGSCIADMHELLMMLCQFCQTHDCCKCFWKGDEREEEEDELPF